MEQKILAYFNSLKEKYAEHKLDEATVDINPFNQFSIWFKDAEETEINNANAMTFATCINNIPSCRVVLLKEYSLNGFVFFTNYESKKGVELDINPIATLNFYWKTLERQIRIVGIVEKISFEESKNYFDTRPIESRIGAWVSNQSKKIPDRKYLNEKFLFYKNKFDNEEIPMPDYWGGYKLEPNYFEFWQSRPNRLHDRIAYKIKEDDWEIFRLSP